MTAGHAAAESPSLLDLVEAQRWQRLQDHFANVLGIALRTVTPSRGLLVNPSWPPTMADDEAIGVLRLGEELEPLLPVKDLPLETSSITTPLGVTYAAVPIRTTPEQILAYFIVGPMVVGPREDKIQFRQRVSAIGADPQTVWNLVLSLKPYTFSAIRSLLNLLEEVGTSLIQFAYQANQLAVILPSSATVDQAVVSYYTDRVINSLLDVATMATRAEGGSVMVYGSEGDFLKIKAAKGLSDAVVTETRQRPGEGIAGAAVAQRTILLIDDQTADPSLRLLMRRKDLASSLVAPLTLEPEQEPLGVLSLRTADRERRFTPQHVEMVRRLLDLTSIALSSLRSAFAKPHTS